MHHFGKGRIFAQSIFCFCIYYLKLKLRVNKLDGQSVTAVSSILREFLVLIRYPFLFTRGGGGEGAAGVYLNICNDGEGILRGQWHIPAKKWPRYPMGLLTDHVS